MAILTQKKAGWGVRKRKGIVELLGPVGIFKNDFPDHHLGLGELGPHRVAIANRNSGPRALLKEH